MKPQTTMIHGGGPVDSLGSLTTPIYETTTYLFDTAAEVKQYAEGGSTRFLYSRYGNPTVQAVERTIAALEGAESALLLSSGQAATTTALLGLLSAGDEVICSSAIYGGTLHLLADLLPKFGITTRFATIEELADVGRIISDNTKLVWFESPINPTLRCVDVAAIATACRARGVTSVIDNTFASPVNQQPIALGVDLVMHSATKYLNGHSDVTAGALVGPARLLAPIEKARRLIGGVLDAHA
ncbi:MAG: PLP-dependent aspartate aminotransferase family protein, partial [Vicinamibacterales bacterium]